MDSCCALTFFASAPGTGEKGLCGGDDGGDDDAAGLDAQLGDSDAGLHIGRASSSLLLAARVAWRCLWQQLGSAGMAIC